VSSSSGPAFSRRRLLAGTGLAGAAAVVAAGTTTAGAVTSGAHPGIALPFHGEHQAGIVTPEQERMVFASFDVTTDRTGLRELLASWTAASERMASGRALAGPSSTLDPPADTGEALDLPASHLTVTVGYGPSLFDDRFGLAGRRPRVLVDLPAFAGDALDPATCGGDLAVQACADDPQVAFHAVHNLARIALGSATIRYLQVGFGRTASSGAGSPAPRNLLGFRDGTANLVPTDDAAMRKHVWVDDADDQPWMLGGTYLVTRRIRIHLEAWDRSTLGQQEQVIGRVRATGAPLGEADENAPLDLSYLDSSGQPRIPVNAHIRLASPVTNGGAAILRRGYSFLDGIDPTTGELDAGLFFICFQKSPADQFIPIQQRLAGLDALSPYLVHTGSGVFACPPGPAPGRPWGHDLW
jgi:deferrochelatase/peroxidase EfeB